MEPLALMSLVTCAVGAASFFAGRQSAAKNDGERWGRLETLMGEVQKALAKLESRIDGQNKYVDDKISEHERKYHSA